MCAFLEAFSTKAKTEIVADSSLPLLSLSKARASGRCGRCSHPNEEDGSESAKDSQPSSTAFDATVESAFSL
jgi:hypothetical protein